jgi:hypothetical protein
MAGKQKKISGKKGESPPIPCNGVSARIVALAAGFDGKPRQAISRTNNADPVILEILSRIAAEFETFTHADNRRLVETVIVCGNELFRRAKCSDRAALRSLFQAVSHLAYVLDTLQDHQFEAVRDLARQSPYWVTAIMLKRDALNETIKSLKSLEVGQQCSINLKAGSHWTAKNTATQLVNELYVQVLRERTLLDALDAEADEFDAGILSESHLAIRALPQLSKETSDQWFDSAVWPLFMRMTKGHLEQTPKYRKLGNYRASHNLNRAGEFKAVESNIRDGIKSQLRQALKSLAGSPPNKST